MIGDASLSPPGPTTVAVKSLRPAWRVTPGIAKFGVSPSGTSTTSVGSFFGSAT